MSWPSSANATGPGSTGSRASASLTITATHAFVDDALHPVIQAMLDVVIAARHEEARRLIAELRASMPDE
ncbi:MAG: hypothetical protein IPK13_10095 [Deltaproteobacteria bacterium]|nr:hypothetical protein [Deltaproteobacteria bacterium]